MNFVVIWHYMKKEEKGQYRLCTLTSKVLTKLWASLMESRQNIFFA